MVHEFMAEDLYPNAVPYSNDDRNEEANPVCIPQEKVIENVKLARAYVPFQFFCGAFMPVEALIHGTGFPELVDPYIKGEQFEEEC